MGSAIVLPLEFFDIGFERRKFCTRVLQNGFLRGGPSDDILGGLHHRGGDQERFIERRAPPGHRDRLSEEGLALLFVLKGDGLSGLDSFEELLEIFVRREAFDPVLVSQRLNQLGASILLLPEFLASSVLLSYGHFPPLI